MKLVIICLLIHVFALPLQASEGEKFTSWLRDFKNEALLDGVSLKTLEASLAGVKYNELVIKLDRNQPEFRLSLKEYLDRTVSEIRVVKGKQELRNNSVLLAEVAERYGVQTRFLVALWGIETDFGRVTGSFPIVEALATLSYDPRRSAFFKKELLDALHVVDDGYVSLDKLEGSGAGAIGFLQFLPSVFRKYGVDYNNDGHIAIWENSADLFGTGANYLAASGWNPKWTWGREVVVPVSLADNLLGLDRKLSLTKWQDIGVRKISGANLPAVDIDASLIKPDQHAPRYFLVYNNFRVLMKWNRSTYYALAVGLLSDQLRDSEKLKVKN